MENWYVHKVTDKITIIDGEAFRRILICARHNLTQLKKADGSAFPSQDQRALEAITRLQSEYPELI